MTTTEFLTPVLALVGWTLVMWVWMYVTRIPAMNAAGIDPQAAAHPGSLGALPSRVRAVADNYNHLHEQPTIFYALMFFSALTGGADGLALMLGWMYVVSRVLHSLIQATVNVVKLRFATFALGSLVLMVLTIKEALRVLGG
ncbi:MAG TPA: MAPEG family protein [Steroidobacteraceae bacterium]|nr:MAPEG family protein [Steroidobacteraceae bacterium]